MHSLWHKPNLITLKNSLETDRTPPRQFWNGHTDRLSPWSQKLLQAVAWGPGAGSGIIGSAALILQQFNVPNSYSANLVDNTKVTVVKGFVEMKSHNQEEFLKVMDRHTHRQTHFLSSQSELKRHLPGYLGYRPLRHTLLFGVSLIQSPSHKLSSPDYCFVLHAFTGYLHIVHVQNVICKSYTYLINSCLLLT